MIERIYTSGGALMQLVAYGAQDIYLSGNPEVTFFKTVYRRHTNFAMESIEQTFSGAVDFGRKVTTTVSRNGDLIGKTYLQLDLPALTGTGTQAWVRNIGHVLIKEVEVSIGGSRIDKHYGQFLHIWQELTQTKEHEDSYNVMIGNTTELTTEAASIPSRTLYIPFQFWFNRHTGSALPIIALQYHEVKFELEFRPFSECHVSSSGTVTVPTLSNASLWIDYIFLDTDERRQFAQIQHEYLIEQLQFAGSESFSQTSIKQRLNFNHPCKELIWVTQLDSNVQNVSAAGGDANRWTDFTDNGAGANPYNGDDPMVDAKLQLNGHDRFSTRKAGYFNLVQPLQHHTRGPATGVYVYSFAIKPEEHQPSGTVNMSRIDNATLNMTMASAAAMKLYTYAINYNVYRNVSGMGGLAYSN
jgi:hypothetical protein